MSNGDLLKQRPTWVRIGLLGLPNRASAWAFVWISLAIAIGCGASGLVNSWYFGLALVMVLAAWWYYASLKWVDQHGRWS